MRQAESREHSYRRQVDRILVTEYGVSFADVDADISGAAGPNVDESFRAGRSPSEFVESVKAIFPIRPVSSFADAAEAGRVNRGTFALALFSKENGEWTQGSDGAVYRMEDGGVSRLGVSLDRTGTKWGFQASFSESASFDDGRPPVGSRYEPLAGDLDIGDAVAALDRHLSAGPAAPKAF